MVYYWNVVYFSVVLYSYIIVGKARWAHRSTRHHIKHEPLGECLMKWRVLRSAHLAIPNDAVCIFWYKYTWNGKIKLNSEAYRRECAMSWFHDTSRCAKKVDTDMVSYNSENHCTECDMRMYHSATLYIWCRSAWRGIWMISTQI